MQKLNIKILWILVIVLALSGATSLFANGGQESGAAAEAAKPIKMVFGHAGMTKETPAQAWADFFKEKIEEISNGQMTVEIFGEGQLGGEQQLVQALQLGTVDVAWAAINNLTPRVPRLSFFNLPYLMGSLEEAYKVQDAITDAAQSWTIAQANIRLIGWEAMGFRAFFNNKKPINTVEDMKGLIWRVPPDDVLIGNYEAWGVHPQPLAWVELFNALSQGVVNGGGNPYDDIISNKLYEVAPYITPMHYNLLCHQVSIRESLYKSMTPKQQELLMEAAEYATAKLSIYVEDTISKREQELRDNPKVKINEPTDEQGFADRAMVNWPKFYKLIGGGDAAIGEQLVKEIKEIADGKRDKLSDNLYLK